LYFIESPLASFLEIFVENIVKKLSQTRCSIEQNQVEINSSDNKTVQKSTMINRMTAKDLGLDAGLIKQKVSRTIAAKKSPITPKHINTFDVEIIEDLDLWDNQIHPVATMDFSLNLQPFNEEEIKTLTDIIFPEGHFRRFSSCWVGKGFHFHADGETTYGLVQSEVNYI
jgi:hypothetical protein